MTNIWEFLSKNFLITLSIYKFWFMNHFRIVAYRDQFNAYNALKRYLFLNTRVVLIAIKKILFVFKYSSLITKKFTQIINNNNIQRSYCHLTLQLQWLLCKNYICFKLPTLDSLKFKNDAFLYENNRGYKEKTRNNFGLK